MLLRKEEVWSSIEEARPIEGSPEYVKITKKEAKLSCQDNQIVHIHSCTTDREAWEVLKSYHQSLTIAARIRILRRLFRCETSQGFSIKEIWERYLDG